MPSNKQDKSVTYKKEKQLAISGSQIGLSEKIDKTSNIGQIGNDENIKKILDLAQSYKGGSPFIYAPTITVIQSKQPLQADENIKESRKVGKLTNSQRCSLDMIKMGCKIQERVLLEHIATNQGIQQIKLLEFEEVKRHIHNKPKLSKWIKGLKNKGLIKVESDESNNNHISMCDNFNNLD